MGEITDEEGIAMVEKLLEAETDRELAAQGCVADSALALVHYLRPVIEQMLEARIDRRSCTCMWCCRDWPLSERGRKHLRCEGD